MRIDVHNHALPAAVIDLLQDPGYGVTVKGATVAGGGSEHSLFPSLHDPAAKLRELTDNQIDAAVLSIAPRLLSYNLDEHRAMRIAEAVNRGLKEMSAWAPDRLHYLGSVPLQVPGLAAEMLSDLRSAGAVGIEIASSVAGVPLDRAGLEPVWRQLEALSLPVFMHPFYGSRHPSLSSFYFQNVIGNPLETTVAAERLLCAGVLDQHPGLRIVLAHAGGFFPWQAGRLRHAAGVRPELAQAPRDPFAYCGQLLFDSLTHDAQALAFLIERVGVENVVLGTDLPYDMAMRRPVETLLQATDPSGARRIAEETPAILFGFSTSPKPLGTGPIAKSLRQ